MFSIEKENQRCFISFFTVNGACYIEIFYQRLEEYLILICLAFENSGFGHQNQKFKYLASAQITTKQVLEITSEDTV